MKSIFYTSGLLLLLLTVGCGSPKPAAASVEPTVTSGTMMVLLTKAGKPEVLEKAFSDYRLNNKGLASRSQNKYKFSFSALNITSAKVVEEVKAHDLVLEVNIVSPIKQ